MLADEAIHPMLRALVAAAADGGDRLDRGGDGSETGRTGRRPIAAETKGEAEIAGVTLHGKADRIDRLADGRLAIVDYKTGQAPAQKAVAEGFRAPARPARR